MEEKVPRSKSKKTFIIGIIHQHKGILGATWGKLNAENEEEASKKAGPWLAKKKIKHRCEYFGNNCSICVAEVHEGIRAILAHNAEDIISD